MVVSATAFADELTVKFDTGSAYNGQIYHAYKVSPSSTDLAGKFTVPGNPVSSATVSGDSVILTLTNPIAPGATPTVAYELPADMDTDVLGFVTLNTATPGLVPTTVAEVTAANVTAIKPYLTNLTITPDTLPITPTFDKKTLAYNVSVPNSVANVTLTPTVAGTATVKVDGAEVNSGNSSNAISLTAGQAKKIEVVVTGGTPETNTTTYTVTVTRAASGGTDPGTDPGTNPNPPSNGTTPDKAADDFNDKNPDAGVTIEFPKDTISDTKEVVDQLGGLKPVIVDNASVSNVKLTPGSGSSQTGAEGLTGFGKGWGAKIEVALKVTPKDGEILMLPVALTFALSQADLALAGLTAEQIVADVSALLAEAIFAKFPAEGTNKDTMQDLTDLLASVIKVTADGNDGISIRLPFLLANGAGDPKLVTDGAKKHLVIFDGERNGWLRDPIYIFRKPAAFAVAGLVASPSSPKVGDTVTLTAAFSSAADTATITVTPPGGTAQSLTTTLAADKLSASATFTAEAAGSYTAAVSARAGSSTETKTVTVTVKEADEEEEEMGGSGSSGCDAGMGLGLLLCGAVIILRKRGRLG